MTVTVALTVARTMSVFRTMTAQTRTEQTR